MSTQFSKGILDALVSGLKRYKEQLQSLGYSNSQIRQLLLTNIFQLKNQGHPHSHNDEALFILALKQNMTKFVNLNQALSRFYLNLQTQLQVINQDLLPYILCQEASKKKLTDISAQQPIEIKETAAQQRTNKQIRVKKRGKKQKRGIKEIQKQAQFLLPLEQEQVNQNLKQIMLLKQILHKKILEEYFKAESLGNQSIFTLAT